MWNGNKRVVSVCAGYKILTIFNNNCDFEKNVDLKIAIDLQIYKNVVGNRFCIRTTRD